MSYNLNERINNHINHVVIDREWDRDQAEMSTNYCAVKPQLYYTKKWMDAYVVVGIQLFSFIILLPLLVCYYSIPEPPEPEPPPHPVEKFEIGETVWYINHPSLPWRYSATINEVDAEKEKIKLAEGTYQFWLSFSQVDWALSEYKQGET